MNAEDPTFRWLGVAGVELEFAGERLLVDPFFSRVPMRWLLGGRPQPDPDLASRHTPAARAVLVTHSHHDHVMDVPSICRRTKAMAFGSANTRSILRAGGVPPEQIRVIGAGDRFAAGPFECEAFAGSHIRIAGWLPFPGSKIPLGEFPFRLWDYRMDAMLSFRVAAGGVSILFWNRADAENAPRADVLAGCVSRKPQLWKPIIDAVRPRLFIPLHWDDFFSPLSKPLRPIWAPPRRGHWFPERMDPAKFNQAVACENPGLATILPEIFTPISLAV